MNIIRHVVIVNVWDINDAQSMNVMRDIIVTVNVIRDIMLL